MTADSLMVTVTPAQQRFISWTSDVLVYTVVLNLFVEYSDAIVIDSFTISILAAIVMKILLDLLTGIEHAVRDFFGRISRVLGLLAMWLVLFLSKFVILEVFDVIFGDHVELGKFIHVVALIVAMMVARLGFGRFYQSLGESSAPGA